LLAAIHGQHESVALLSSKVQREHLDAYAQASQEVSKVALHWRVWSDAKLLALAARERVAEMEKERSQLVWEVEEISKLAPKAGEWEAMVASHQEMAQSSEMTAACESALAELRDEDGSIASRLSKIAKSLSGFSDSKAKQAALALGEAAGIVDDAARDLSRAVDGGEFSKSLLESLEERMASFHAIGRKLRVAPESLTERLLLATARLEKLELGMDSKKLDQEESRACLELAKSCAELSKKRAKAAVKLAAAASSNLERLGMGKACVLIELTPREPGPDGADHVEFAMTSYPGAKPLPLAKCASGGELARLGLALCAASIEQSQPGCMVFDEVDAGIGGPTATMVGEMLAVLGKKSQALVVTHLPQVAALAATHYAVGKEMGSSGPQSKVVLVAGQERQKEIARMLGDSKGKSALDHAGSLLGDRLGEPSISIET
jgi:DNA repair protein RecN (Recombination protein N)